MVAAAGNEDAGADARPVGDVVIFNSRVIHKSDLKAEHAALPCNFFVLGYPKNMNNSEGDRCEATQAFKEDLERRTGLEVVLWDERLTTVEAERILMDSGVRRENRKTYIDKMAAAVILQNYLDAKCSSL